MPEDGEHWALVGFPQQLLLLSPGGVGSRLVGLGGTDGVPPSRQGVPSVGSEVTLPDSDTWIQCFIALVSGGLRVYKMRTLTVLVSHGGTVKIPWMI